MPDIAKTGARGEAAADYAAVFRGRPDEVGRARVAVARSLAGCPVADDAVLIASELAANAVVHSGSRGRFFAVRCLVRRSSCQVEVEDCGGLWRPGPRDLSRPHGLDLVDALAGPGNWGVAGDSSGRVVWARLTW